MYRICLPMIIALMISICGCSGGSGESPKIPVELKVVSITPDDGASEVERECYVKVTFSENIKEETVTPLTVIVIDDQNKFVESESVIVSGNQITFKPTEKLYPSTTYIITLAAGIMGKAGSVLANNISYQFTTKNASWGTPSAFSGMGHSVVDLDDKGKEIIAWERYNNSNNFYEIMMTQLLDGSWTMPIVLSGSARNTFSPRIASDNRGNAIIVWQLWQQPSGIVIKDFRDGQWGKNVTVDMGNDTISAPSVAMNTEGKTVVVWEQGREIYKLEAQDGNWGAVEKISMTADCENPVVKISETGSIIITWEYSSGNYNAGKIYSKEYIVGIWNTPKIISYVGKDPMEYKIATDSKGNAIVVWFQLESNNYRVYKNEFRNNQWSSPTALNPLGSTAYKPAIAISSNGNAIITWQQTDNWLSPLYQIYAMEYKGGSWGTSQLLSPSGVESILPNVTLDRKGNGFLLWNQANGSKFDLYRMEYKNFTWGNRQLMSTSNNELNPIYFSTSTNHGGDAAIVWSQSDGVNWQLYRVHYQ